MASMEGEQVEEITQDQNHESEPEPAAATTEEKPSSTPEDLIAWFNSTIKDYDATFIVYYRGLW